MQKVNCLSSGDGHIDCHLPLKLLSLHVDLNYFIKQTKSWNLVKIGQNS